MSLRLIEIVIPVEDLSDLTGLLEENAAARIWTEELESGIGRAKVLLPIEKTESALDLINQRYGGREGFRAMLLPVEATVPELAPEEEATAGAADAGESETHDVMRISRDELYQDVVEASRLSRIFLIMVALSTLVAAIGLTRGDVAIIIGAMVIAPLLGPNVALALAAALGDTDLAAKSVRTIAAGIAVGGLLAVAFGMVMRVDPAAPQLAARTDLGISDIILASSAGVAGTLSFTTGLPTALIGVMVAVALLPPLVTAGLYLGSGAPGLALRAAALLVTNIACINLAGVVTFLTQRIRPRTWWEERKARRAIRFALGFWFVVLALLVALILLFWRE